MLLERGISGANQPHTTGLRSDRGETHTTDIRILLILGGVHRHPFWGGDPPRRTAPPCANTHGTPVSENEDKILRQADCTPKSVPADMWHAAWAGASASTLSWSRRFADCSSLVAFHRWHTITSYILHAASANAVSANTTAFSPIETRPDRCCRPTSYSSLPSTMIRCPQSTSTPAITAIPEPPLRYFERSSSSIIMSTEVPVKSRGTIDSMQL